MKRCDNELKFKIVVLELVLVCNSNESIQKKVQIQRLDINTKESGPLFEPVDRYKSKDLDR